MSVTQRVFLDTNVFIIGLAMEGSLEAAILSWAGCGHESPGDVEIIVSEELFDQIRRVAKRLQGKDWGGAIISRLWREMRLVYILLPDYTAEDYPGLLKEDIGVYLTAQRGQAQCFVSSNRELVRTLAEKTGEFECMIPEAFVDKYLKTLGTT